MCIYIYSMCVCVYRSICVYIYVSMYLYPYICICIYIYIYIYMYVCIHIYTYIHIYHICHTPRCACTVGPATPTARAAAIQDGRCARVHQSVDIEATVYRYLDNRRGWRLLRAQKVCAGSQRNIPERAQYRRGHTGTCRSTGVTDRERQGELLH